MSNILNEVKNDTYESNHNMESNISHKNSNDKEDKTDQVMKKKSLTDNNLENNLVEPNANNDINNFDFYCGRKLSLNSYSQNLYITSSDNMDQDSDNKYVNKIGMNKNSLIHKLNNNSDSTMLSARVSNNLFNSNDNLKDSIDNAIQLKKKGNEFINNKNFEKAIECFETALSTLKKDYNGIDFGTKTNIDSIRIDCLNNIAICNYIKKEYDKVLSYTQKVSFF